MPVLVTAIELVLALLFVLITRELFALIVSCGIHINRRLGMLLFTLMILVQILSGSRFPAAMLISSLVLSNVLFQRGNDYAGSMLSTTILFASLLYLGSIYSILITALEQGKYVELGSFYLILVARDTVAGIYGRLFSGKVMTDISPRKTWQGSLAGGIVALSLWLWMAKGMGMAYEYAVLQGLGAGILGQVGDLLGSALKRTAGVRHSGSLLGRMGGVIDMFDSALFTLPFWYFFTLVGTQK